VNQLGALALGSLRVLAIAHVGVVGPTRAELRSANPRQSKAIPVPDPNPGPPDPRFDGGMGRSRSRDLTAGGRCGTFSARTGLHAEGRSLGPAGSTAGSLGIDPHLFIRDRDDRPVPMLPPTATTILERVGSPRRARRTLSHRRPIP
jgi:hypothetical protein